MVVAEPSDPLAGELRRLLPALRASRAQGRRVTVCFDRGGWSPALFADITAAGFDVLPGARARPRTCPLMSSRPSPAPMTGPGHEYDLADATAELGISEGRARARP